jgi:hypothetical protein
VPTETQIINACQAALVFFDGATRETTPAAFASAADHVASVTGLGFNEACKALEDELKKTNR